MGYKWKWFKKIKITIPIQWVASHTQQLTCRDIGFQMLIQRLYWVNIEVRPYQSSLHSLLIQLLVLENNIMEWCKIIAIWIKNLEAILVNTVKEIRLVWIVLLLLVVFQSLNKRVGDHFVILVDWEPQAWHQMITKCLITILHQMILITVKLGLYNLKENLLIIVSPISILRKIQETQCSEIICKRAQAGWDKTY